MAVRYLSIAGLAKRAGITVNTATSYGREGRLPEADVLIGEDPRAVRGWTPQTVDAWLASRPGKGGRPRSISPDRAS